MVPTTISYLILLFLYTCNCLLLIFFKFTFGNHWICNENAKQNINGYYFNNLMLNVYCLKDDSFLCIFSFNSHCAEIMSHNNFSKGAKLLYSFSFEYQIFVQIIFRNVNSSVFVLWLQYVKYNNYYFNKWIKFFHSPLFY